jgi:hypothetical protein
MPYMVDAVIFTKGIVEFNNINKILDTNDENIIWKNAT